MWRQICQRNPNGDCIYDMRRKGGNFSLFLNKLTYWYYKAFHSSPSPPVPGGPTSHRAFSCSSFLSRVSARQGKFVLGKCRSGFGPGELLTNTILLIKLAPVLCVVRVFQQLKANILLGLWSVDVQFWVFLPVCCKVTERSPAGFPSVYKPLHCPWELADSETSELLWMLSAESCSHLWKILITGISSKHLVILNMGDFSFGAHLPAPCQFAFHFRLSNCSLGKGTCKQKKLE